MQLPTFTIYNGDALEVLKQLPDESVHICCTSPPYFNLRNYNCDGQIGLEKDQEEHIAALVKIFNEVRRVMRADGTLWMNYGDCYIDKELQGMPWRVALALQKSGWILRADLIWHKINPLPSSCKDRPATDHEYIFMFSKSKRYFYDNEAIKEPCAAATIPRMLRGVSNSHKHINGAPGQIPHSMNQPRLNRRDAFRNGKAYINNHAFNNDQPVNKESLQQSINNVVSIAARRNKRSVWSIATEPFSARKYGFKDIEHYATFPSVLPMTCIKAGTSEYGCCAQCAAPWKRLVAPTPAYQQLLGKGYHDHSNDDAGGMRQAKRDGFQSVTSDYITVGWQATCGCDVSEVQPAVVLDPFAGAGTTLLVANRLGRTSIGVELNPNYCRLAEARIKADAPLLAVGGINAI